MKGKVMRAADYGEIESTNEGAHKARPDATEGG